MPEPDLTAAAARLRLALDLAETGIEMKRQQLRREHPEASREQIARLLARWLQARPGAEHGDAPGRPVPRPRPGP